MRAGPRRQISLEECIGSVISLPKLPSSARTPAVVSWSIVLAIAVVYAVAIGTWAPLAMQDLPNHVARAAAIDDLVLHGGHGIGSSFEFHFMAVPYVLHDLLLAGCVELFGANGAAAVWPAIVLLAMPLALVAYARVKGVRGSDLPVLFLIGLYLATETAFWKAFLAYCLALAMILLTLAAADLWRARASAPRFAAYLSLLVFGYLTHLTATLFAAAALALTSALRLWHRRFSLRRELSLLLPIAVVFVWHLIGQSVPVLTQKGAPQWHSAFDKLRFTLWPFVRYDRYADVALLCVAFAGLAVVSAQRARSREGRIFRIEMLLLAAMFALVYLVLPHAIGPLSWLDMRAVPMVAVFLVLACFAPRAGQDRSPALPRDWGYPRLALALPLVLAALLSTLNLVELGLHARKDERWLADYRRVSATLPRGAWVLPVYTDTQKRAVRSTLHAGVYALLDAGAPDPYLFSRNLGDAMVYFSYRDLPYAPDQSWYVEPALDQSIDWRAVAAAYRYLLVSKPFDPGRMPLQTSPVSESPSVALLAIKGLK